MSKIFLTGGAGFIGGHIAERLLKDGHEVTIYDNLSSGRDANIPEGVQFIKGDILDYKKMLKASKGHDVFNHHAAQLEIFKSITEPADDLTTNAIGTLNALRASVENGIEYFVGASSSGVYGQVPLYAPRIAGGGYIMQNSRADENSKTNPQWAYGVSKLACEHYARIFSHDYGIKASMLRYSIVYGPREWYGRALTMFMARLLEGARPVVFGKGNQVRDMLYVTDAADFNSLAIRYKLEGLYNVCSEHVYTMNGLANKVIKRAGYSFDILYDGVKEGDVSEYQNRIRIPSELMLLAPSNAKAVRAGWSQSVNINQGIRRQWEWLQENKELYTEEHMRV